MSTLRNSVQLIGRLGNDPEVKTFGENKTKVRFSLATSDYHVDKNGERVEDTQWHNIIGWGNVATIAEKYLKKGHEVAVRGKLTYSDWVDKDNQKHYMTEVVVSEILLMEKKK
jgi:single-strand DNA-binding protein